MESHAPIPRFAGAGLAVYALGTAVAFFLSGSPGGDYSDAHVATYISAGHFVSGAVLWTVAALGALGLVAFAQGVRAVPGIGAAAARLAQVGCATSIVGAFVSGGVLVAMAEGGAEVRNGVPHAAVYTLTEIGNLLAACAPAMCLGVAAILAAVRGQLTPGVRVAAVVAGICGVLAPLFFTYFVYLLAAVIAGMTIAVRGARRSSVGKPVISMA